MYLVLPSEVPCELIPAIGIVAGTVGVPSLRSAEPGERSSPCRCVVSERFVDAESIDRSNRGVVDITWVVIDELTQTDSLK